MGGEVIDVYRRRCPHCHDSIEDGGTCGGYSCDMAADEDADDEAMGWEKP